MSSSAYDERRVDVALAAVRSELLSAMAAFPTFNSPHEGYAVLCEEVDELWDEVKANHGLSPAARIEATQVAAMAVRYIVDCDPLVDRPALGVGICSCLKGRWSPDCEVHGRERAA